jgi:hypothetical protein
MKLNQNDKFLLVVQWLVVLLLKLLIATAVAVLVAAVALPAGDAERGYQAVGGEHMLVLFVWGMTFWAADSLFKKRGQNDD